MLKKYILIRRKKAHSSVAEDMTDHTIDGQNAYMAQDLDEDTAIEKAIAGSVDAIVIDTRPNRIHRPKPQKDMLMVTAACLLVGLSLMIAFSGRELNFLLIHLLFTGIGFAGMIGIYFMDFTILGKHPKMIYFGVLALVVACFIGRIIAWDIFDRLMLQSIVLLLPLAFADIVFAAGNKGYRGIILCVLAYLPLCYIALLNPVIKESLYAIAVCLALFGIAIYKNWFGTKRLCSFLIICTSHAIFMILLIVNSGHWLLLWLKSAFNPYIDPYAMGFWSVLTREMMSGAQLFGAGYMPLPDNGLIWESELFLIWLAARFGWIAFAAIIAVLLFFIVIGFRRCMKQKNSLGFFVSITLMLMFCIQVFGYVVHNLGIQFLSPASLPLISYSNTAMMINLLLIGILLSVFRTGDEAIDENPHRD